MDKQREETITVIAGLLAAAHVIRHGLNSKETNPDLLGDAAIELATKIVDAAGVKKK